MSQDDVNSSIRVKCGFAHGEHLDLYCVGVRLLPLSANGSVTLGVGAMCRCGVRRQRRHALERTLVLVHKRGSNSAV